VSAFGTLHRGQNRPVLQLNLCPACLVRCHGAWGNPPWPVPTTVHSPLEKHGHSCGLKGPNLYAISYLGEFSRSCHARVSPSVQGVVAPTRRQSSPQSPAQPQMGTDFQETSRTSGWKGDQDDGDNSTPGRKGLLLGSAREAGRWASAGRRRGLGL
jgi:hypothetical protein